MKNRFIAILIAVLVFAVVIAVNVGWFNLVTGAEIPLWLKWVLLRG